MARKENAKLRDCRKTQVRVEWEELRRENGKIKKELKKTGDKLGDELKDELGEKDETNNIVGTIESNDK